MDERPRVAPDRRVKSRRLLRGSRASSGSGTILLFASVLQDASFAAARLCEAKHSKEMISGTLLLALTALCSDALRPAARCACAARVRAYTAARMGGAATAWVLALVRHAFAHEPPSSTKRESGRLPSERPLGTSVWQQSSPAAARRSPRRGLEGSSPCIRCLVCYRKLANTPAVQLSRPRRAHHCT